MNVGRTEQAEQSAQLAELKRTIREQAHENRRQQENKDGLSRDIIERLFALREYQRSATVLFYVDVRAEVRTRHALPTALQHGKRIVVPYCVDGELQLFHLKDMDELSLGMYRILEPRQELRGLPEKQVRIDQLDLIIVPGVAFDTRGGRTGHGKGYYDKLLEHARPDTPLVALAFDCQMFAEVPMQAHDIYMDLIITPSAVYAGRGRRQDA